jgi:acyl-CoA thioesterase-1
MAKLSGNRALTSAIWKPALVFSMVVGLFSLGHSIGANGGVNAADKEKAEEVVILALGDSLTAGYQLPPDKSFPAQLEKALRERGKSVRVLNAGVSGDTATEGLARLEWSLTDEVDAVIVELGANDGLRGTDPKVTEQALDQILASLKQRGLPVLLAGMEAPRNWGPEYVAAFKAIYPRLAEKHGAILYPFFLEGVAAQPQLNQPDGLHPTAEGVAVIVRNIMPDVERLIERARAKVEAETKG